MSPLSPMSLAFLFALTAAAVGPPPGVPTSVRPVGAEAVVLLGRTGSAELPVVLPAAAGRRSPAVVTMHWRVSEVVDPTRSSLTVRWNGVPLRTIALDRSMVSGTPVPLRVELPPTAGGFGALSVTSHLVLADDERCPTDPDRAWLTIDEATEVAWTSHGGPLPTTYPVSLATWWDRWVDDAVEVVVPASDAAVVVGVEMDHVLRDRGLSVVAGGAPHRWVLTEAELPAEAPAEAVALVQTDGDHTLHLWAPSLADAQAVVRALPQLAARCPSERCWVPAQRPGAFTARPAGPADPELVLGLSDVGYDRGWTARGAGVHSLRLVWPRPPGVTAQEGSRVELLVEHAPADLLDPQRSRVEATVNGRPVGTWRLDGVDGRWVVGVPDDLWADDAWVVDLDAHLWPRDGEDCRTVDPSALWLVVDGDSGLRVPRTEAPTGLAAFAAQGQPRLSWDRPLDASDRWALATAAYPLRGTSPWQRASDCAGDCLVVPDADDGDLAMVGGLWADRRGDLAQPLAPARGAALAVHGAGAAIVPGALRDLVPPRWGALHGPVAVFDGEWTVRGAAPAAPVVVTVPPTGPIPRGTEAPRPPDEVVRHRVADLVFGLVVLLATALGAFWIWTGVRRGGPVEELS